MRNICTVNRHHDTETAKLRHVSLLGQQNDIAVNHSVVLCSEIDFLEFAEFFRMLFYVLENSFEIDILDGFSLTTLLAPAHLFVYLTGVHAACTFARHCEFALLQIHQRNHLINLGSFTIKGDN